MKYRIRIALAVSALALVATACVPLPPPTEAPVTASPEAVATALPPTAAPAATATGSGLSPASAAVCAAAAEAMRQALPGVEVIAAAEPVEINDVARGASGTACRAIATGTGETFSSPVETVQAITRLLGEGGWQEDMNLIADGPTGTATGYRNGDMLCLVAADWNPGPAVTCPADKPISECNVPRDQQIYEVTVDCAMIAAQ